MCMHLDNIDTDTGIVFLFLKNLQLNKQGWDLRHMKTLRDFLLCFVLFSVCQGMILWFHSQSGMGQSGDKLYGFSSYVCRLETQRWLLVHGVKETKALL